MQHAQSWQNAAEWNIPHSRTTVKLFCSGTPLFLSSMERVAGAAVPALNIDRQAAVAPNTCGAAIAELCMSSRQQEKQQAAVGAVGAAGAATQAPA